MTSLHKALQERFNTCSVSPNYHSQHFQSCLWGQFVPRQNHCWTWICPITTMQLLIVNSDIILFINPRSVIEIVFYRVKDLKKNCECGDQWTNVLVPLWRCMLGFLVFFGWYIISSIFNSSFTATGYLVHVPSYSIIIGRLIYSGWRQRRWSHLSSSFISLSTLQQPPVCAKCCPKTTLDQLVWGHFKLWHVDLLNFFARLLLKVLKQITSDVPGQCKIWKEKNKNKVNDGKANGMNHTGK